MKKNYILLIILFVLSLGCIIFTYNDYFLYQTPIMRVTSIESKNITEDKYEEPLYVQNIKGTILNGEYKGKTYETINSYTKSLVMDDKLTKGSEVFVELSNDGSDLLGLHGIKRDKYLVILIVIFIDLIIIIAGRKGLKTLLSLIVNLGITAGSIILFMNNYTKMNLLLLYFIVSIIYIVVSLFITNGRSRKTLAAILSSIISLLITFGLSFILIKINESNLYIWNIDYIEAVYDYNNYLYVCVLLCGLGAIMDISITISSALNELIEKDKKIKKDALIKSGKEISKDIVGTMINVMLFTCYTSVIPTIVIATKNKIPFTNAMDFYGGLELMIVLCNCIGIVLTIPISLFISIWILNKKKEVMKK